MIKDVGESVCNGCNPIVDVGVEGRALEVVVIFVLGGGSGKVEMTVTNELGGGVAAVLAAMGENVFKGVAGKDTPAVVEILIKLEESSAGTGSTRSLVICACGALPVAKSGIRIPPILGSGPVVAATIFEGPKTPVWHISILQRLADVKISLPYSV